MSGDDDRVWQQIQQLYDQQVPIHTLERGIVNTLTTLDDKGLTVVSSKTQNERRIYRRSLQKLWLAAKEGAGVAVKGGWDAIEAAIIAHLPNIEYAVRPSRLYYVDSPSHELGTVQRHDQSVATLIEVDDELGLPEALDLEPNEEVGQHPPRTVDPIWGPFGEVGEAPVHSEIVPVLLDDDDPIWREVQSLITEGYCSIVLSGPPGTSKTWYAHQVAFKLTAGQPDRVWTIQFHPSYAYEDFVEGRVPTSMQADEPFPVRPKIFLRACIAASKSSSPFVLVIDEISRGDPSRIFGEVLTYIEHRDQSFILPCSGRVAFVPRNLIILGTMNPYDKSVSDLDQALQRRFEYIPMHPDSKLLEKLLTEAGAPDDLGQAIDAFFRELQSKCPNRIGHAYFKGICTWEQMPSLWRRKLQRVLEDHFYPDTTRVDDVKRRFDFYFLRKQE